MGTLKPFIVPCKKKPNSDTQILNGMGQLEILLWIKVHRIQNIVD